MVSLEITLVTVLSLVLFISGVDSSVDSVPCVNKEEVPISSVDSTDVFRMLVVSFGIVVSLVVSGSLVESGGVFVPAVDSADEITSTVDSLDDSGPSVEAADVVNS